jgi:hypothetical protein
MIAFFLTILTNKEKSEMAFAILGAKSDTEVA